MKQVFADMFYPYHADETARDELEALKQVSTQKADGFQTYLSKFQYLVAQSNAGNTPAIHRRFAEGFNIQLATMIYSMEKVPTTLKAWMEKAIDFHKQKACIIALKKGQGLPLSSFSSNSHSAKDPDAMDVNTIRLKKLSQPIKPDASEKDFVSDVAKRDIVQMNADPPKHPENPRGITAPNKSEILKPLNPL